MTSINIALSILMNFHLLGMHRLAANVDGDVSPLPEVGELVPNHLLHRPPRRRGPGWVVAASSLRSEPRGSARLIRPLRINQV